jgi:hypothetical protein
LRREREERGKKGREYGDEGIGIGRKRAGG